MMTDTLYLPLKKQWFDMIKSGIKLEEYREIKPYYIRKFIKFDTLRKDLLEHYQTGFDEGEIVGIEDELRLLSDKLKKVVFTLGYPKADDADRRIEFDYPTIRLGEGRTDWGAAPGTKYFVITWRT